jgi:hypothetical protein
MAQVNKIDSNVVGLRYCEEDSIGVLPGSPVWNGLEPNSFNDFGGNLTLLARNPINPSRQRKKGVVTDIEAAGGFNNDFIPSYLQDILQGFVFADLRRKGEQVVTAVDIDTVNPDEYEVASTSGFLVGSLVKGAGFSNSANNGVNPVTAVVADTSVEVATGALVTEAGAATKSITVVGHQGTAGDIEVNVTGDYATLTSTTLDFTTLGLIPGEWIFVGGDTAATRFFNAVNNGFKRIRSIAANAIVLDKSDAAMVTDDGTIDGAGGTGNTIRLFFGRVLKNESDGTLVVRRSYQLERTLGAPDDAALTDVQAEYLEGAVPNELAINIPTADKVTLDLGFIASTHTTVDAGDLKAGTRPTLQEQDAYNTSSDFARIKMAVHSETSEVPTPLFAFLEDLTITINNNVSPAKAVGVLGGFDVQVGTFAVSGQLTAYFSNVAAIQAVQSNADVTLDFAIAKANSGFVLDLPLIALGDGRANIEQDQAIKLPLSMEAASAAKIDSNLDYTVMMVFFDYLPDASEE